MWFKNLRIYRLNKKFDFSPEALNELLAPHEFQPCGKLDPQRTGWVPPLGRHGVEFVHVTSGYIMVAFKREEKILPAAVINQYLDEKVLAISEEESRHVSRKERDTLKDEVIFELMPKAFSKASTCFAYIALKEQLIVVNSSSAKAAEDLLTAMREAIGSLSCIPLTPKMQPTQVMTDWLRNKEATNNLTLAEECELQAPKDGRVIRCKNQDLTADEVLSHIESGMVVSKLALVWRETVQLLLDDQCAIKRLKFDDSVREKAESAHADTVAQEFDQEFAVMTTELAGLISDITQSMGGESDSVFDDD